MSAGFTPALFYFSHENLFFTAYQNLPYFPFLNTS